MEDEIKKPLRSPDGELLRSMIHVSNNSQMTNEAAIILTNSLSKEDLTKLKHWLQHAQRETDFKIQTAKGRSTYLPY